ncbi:hypothetical protein [Shinella sp. HZN7]|jgi:hypothetical protein|uniref:hypothetical protein n=1 Tax=Alphaproteobacteria TaxID=28211 RepID=UPI0011AB89D6|nr:hypothetical protein [Shinella sp. HZN7]
MHIEKREQFAASVPILKGSCIRRSRIELHQALGSGRARAELHPRGLFSTGILDRVSEKVITREIAFLKNASSRPLKLGTEREKVEQRRSSIIQKIKDRVA